MPLIPTSHWRPMPRDPRKPSLCPMATRVLIVDDHLAIREGIRSLLAPEADFVVVAEAVDGNDGLQKALSLRPDLILLDNSMPGKRSEERRVGKECRSRGWPYH